MKLIRSAEVARLIASGKASNLRVTQDDARCWFFAFDVPSSEGEGVEVLSILTDRGEHRTWADVGRLLQYLEKRFGVTEGAFQLQGVNTYESQ